MSSIGRLESEGVMMKKLTYIIPVLALVFFSACDTDYTEIDTGLSGRWISSDGSVMYLNGMSFTRTGSGGAATGTFAATDGHITFTRIGYSSEKFEYKLDFPVLVIGEITYYHDSPSEPPNVVGIWYLFRAQGPSLTFFPGKRVKDENQKETWVIEGAYVIHRHTKGKYTISDRNLPNNSVLVFEPTHIHGAELWTFINVGMPAEWLSFFDQTILTIPATEAAVENWWFTVDEIRRYFRVTAERATDQEIKDGIYGELRWFLYDYNLEMIPYTYSVEFDPDVATLYGIEKNAPNKISMTLQGFIVGGGGRQYVKWDEVTGTEIGDPDDWSQWPLED
jgi:hypothetical protein